MNDLNAKQGQLDDTFSSQAGEDEFLTQRHRSRAGLLWAVLVFQAKLVLDGLRDVVLVPVSLFAALFGLIAGGNEPDRFFQQVLRLGRRSEVWINLFGHRSHKGTSDALIDPFKEKVMSDAQNKPWVRKTSQNLNEKLDRVNQRIEQAARQDPKS